MQQLKQQIKAGIRTGHAAAVAYRQIARSGVFAKNVLGFVEYCVHHASRKDGVVRRDAETPMNFKDIAEGMRAHPKSVGRWARATSCETIELPRKRGDQGPARFFMIEAERIGPKWDRYRRAVGGRPDEVRVYFADEGDCCTVPDDHPLFELDVDERPAFNGQNVPSREEELSASSSSDRPWSSSVEEDLSSPPQVAVAVPAPEKTPRVPRGSEHPPAHARDRAAPPAAQTAGRPRGRTTSERSQRLRREGEHAAGQSLQLQIASVLLAWRAAWPKAPLCEWKAAAALRNRLSDGASAPMLCAAAFGSRGDPAARNARSAFAWTYSSLAAVRSYAAAGWDDLRAHATGAVSPATSASPAPSWECPRCGARARGARCGCCSLTHDRARADWGLA